MFFKKYKIIGLIVGLGIIILLIFGGSRDVKSETIEPILEIKEEKKIEIQEYYYVDIKGMVNNPGVYKVNNDERVIDVINKAGGLTDEADTSLINLSKKVKDEMVIIIYSKEEVLNSNPPNEIIKIVEKECMCSEINNDSCINVALDSSISDSGYISLNKATLEELTSVPGLGESKAKSILEYRSLNNGFKTIDELLNVSGIGEKVFEKIKIYFSL